VIVFHSNQKAEELSDGTMTFLKDAAEAMYNKLGESDRDNIIPILSNFETKKPGPKIKG
jgi:hypothetical protein